MNTMRSNARREEGGVANERISPLVYQVPIVILVGENEEVPLKEPQVLTEPQDIQVTKMSPMAEVPQSPFVEEDMINV